MCLCISGLADNKYTGKNLFGVLATPIEFNEGIMSANGLRPMPTYVRIRRGHLVGYRPFGPLPTYVLSVTGLAKTAAWIPGRS